MIKYEKFDLVIIQHMQIYDLEKCQLNTKEQYIEKFLESIKTDANFFLSRSGPGQVKAVTISVDTELRPEQV